MSLRKILILILCGAGIFPLMSQNEVEDSLKAVLKGNIHDTIYAKTGYELFKVLIKKKDTSAIKELASEFMSRLNSSKNNFLGNYYYLIMARYEDDIRQNPESALAYYLESRDYALKVPDYKSAAIRTQKIATINLRMGNFKIAATEYFQAVNWNERSGNLKGVCYNYLGLGELYRLQKNHTKAIKMFRNAYEIAIKIQDPVGLSASLNNIGMMHHEFKNLDSSIYYYTKALDLNRSLNNEMEIAGTTERIASIYAEKKELDKAEQLFEQALKIKLKFGNKHELGVTYLMIADLETERKNDRKALEYYDKAIEISKEISNERFREHAYRIEALIYKSNKEYEKSADFFAKYIGLHDSLISIDNNLLASELEEKYQNEKKQKEISLLNKDKEIQESNMVKQKQFSYFVILIAGLLAALALFIFRGLKQKQRDNKMLSEKNAIIEEQKEIVEEKNKEITDSINYAKRIQYTLLAHSDFLKVNIPEHFVFFKPKDIVSGDFYWATKKGNKFFLAVCDSTGHGVPGAFMSLLNIGFLSEAINEKNIEEPHKVFNHVRQRLVDNLSKEGQKDGFDGILVCFEEGSKKISYAAANNAPLVISKTKDGFEIIDLPKDRMPVGYSDKNESFTIHEYIMNGNDTLYLYTDGFADQFGGDKGKKYMYKRLNNFILDISSAPIDQQEEKLRHEFMSWKGKLDQIDDVCVIGIKV